MKWEGLYVQNEYHAYMLRRIVMLKAEADVLVDYNHRYAHGYPCMAATAMLAVRAASTLNAAALQARRIEPDTTIPAAIVRV